MHCYLAGCFSLIFCRHYLALSITLAMMCLMVSSVIILTSFLSFFYSSQRSFFCSLSKNPELAAVARKQRYAGLRGKCCGTRVRGSVPQPQSSSLALPCQILVSVDGCQSLAAFGSCIHRMRAPSRRPKTPAGAGGKRVPSGHNRRRRLATRRCDTKRAGTTAVVLRDD